MMNFFSNSRSKSVGSPSSAHPIADKITPPKEKQTRHSGTSPSTGPSSDVKINSKTPSGDHETDGRINLSRTDGITQDILNVFSKPGVSEVVNTSAKEDKHDDNHDDHNGNITISRSDGVAHDLIQVFKAVSDAQGDTLKVKGRAPSVGKMDLSSITSSIVPPVTSPTNNITVNREISSLYYPKNFLPHGDILVHTGNFTRSGTEAEFKQFNEWLESVADLYHYRIVIFGHRDVKVFGNNWDAMKALLSNATHVPCHADVTVLGIRFYGAPWHWGHKVNYTVRPGAPSSTTGRFDDIPAGTQCLLTHGPAYDRLDITYGGNTPEHWGSRELAESIRRVRPGLHLHGHVKDSRGIIPEFGNNPLTVNSSMVDKDVTVLFATPHVIRASQALFDKSKNLVTWSFAIDSFDG